MQTVSVLLTLCATYAAVATADLAFLVWKWRDVDNGLNPLLVAALWPVVLPLLAAYYLAASCYTFGVVMRGRRAALPHRAAAPTPAWRS
ncbi:hypothetical protein [Methylobacterium dankookense]|uniref:Uncharacterized protein n=1 Tax=Methylobacterium dankookense TaxID=560405 RepID=A0A564FV52_9HYPH|nr:hypothetical protein [Methylobacterium dankookense]GJD54965.1 hypothetical protein IFDJLNFL_0846 [Methylobacterium dankookense]VUF11963.1 hypothetical protein MTDSW087_01650 [Methylobacterium dankookense]